MDMHGNWSLLGHEWAVDLLRSNLVNGRLRHAYLFCGPPGIGRRTLALKLAQSINCEQSEPAGDPCGRCPSCRQIEKMQHPDLTVVQSEQVGGTLKVQQIREMQHSLSLSPYAGRYRVALILRFEEANPNAANALLKTLEEPPERVVLMLTASEPERLLPTIVSRCEIIRLRPLPLEAVSAGLQTHFGVSQEQAELLAHLSGGRPGLSIQYLQNPELLQTRQSCLDDLAHLLNSKRVERFAYAEQLSKGKDKTGDILQTWATFWRDVLLVRSGSNVPVTNVDRIEEIRKIAQHVSLPSAKALIDEIDHTQYLLSRNVNKTLTLEVLLLNLPFIPV
jgi:DNA polymerase-3 subunit delta'